MYMRPLVGYVPMVRYPCTLIGTKIIIIYYNNISGKSLK